LASVPCAPARLPHACSSCSHHRREAAAPRSATVRAPWAHPCFRPLPPAHLSNTSSLFWSLAVLNRHPNITCAGEIFNPHNAKADHLRRQLGYTLAAQRADIGGYLGRWLARCTTRVCGFKIFPYHLPFAQLPQLFPDGCGVRKLVLERRNITAQYASWRRAMSSGNWYVSPLNVTVSNTVLSGEPATPAVGGSPFRVSNAANLMSLPKFASQHTLWYRKVRALAPHAAAYSFLFEDMILHRASEIDDPENSRERVLGELYSLFGIPVADQLCLFDRCSSARLRARENHREFWERALGADWRRSRADKTWAGDVSAFETPREGVALRAWLSATALRSPAT